MNGLPEIGKNRSQLTGPSTPQAPKSGAQNFLEDSGLELKGSSISRPSTASSARGWVANSPSGSARFTPSPPPGAARPRSSLAASRRSLELVRVSKSELEKTEEALTSLRSEVVQMQAEIRRLQHFEQDFVTLQRGCGQVAEALGCSLVEGVAASAIQDILLSRVNSLVESRQQDTEKCDKYRTELEQCQGEVAAAKVQLASLEGHLKKTRKQEKHLEAELQQAKGELESLSQTCARTGATVESLRQQLTEAEGQVGRRQRESSCELTHLQTEVGRLKREVTEKDDVVRGLQEQLSVADEDKKNMKERLSVSEAMHADLCTQLAISLQLDPSDSLDVDHLLTQVGGLVGGCEELRLRCETLSSSMHTAELDAQASRETILRLVAESKQQDKQQSGLREELASLRQQLEERTAAAAASEQDRVGLQERLRAAKETMVSLEREVQVKDERLSEVCRNMDVCRLASDSTKSLANDVQAKYDELVTGLGTALSVQSGDVNVLLQKIWELVQTCSQQSGDLREQQLVLTQQRDSLQSSQQCTCKLEEELRRERSRLKKAEGEVGALEVVQEGLTRDMDKCQAFTRKVAKALALDRSTAEILTGDFAHDAVLMRAEQLVKMESEALLNKQTALYSLQRKLKTCRQSEQNKELHLGLLQKKVEQLQASLKAASLRETECKASVSKMKKVEQQLQELEDRIREQRMTISQLQADNVQLQRLKESCSQLEEENSKLTARGQELDHTCAKQGRELAEARQQAKARLEKFGKERETMRGELETLNSEVEKLRSRDEKLSVFKTAVQRLLVSHQESLGEEGTPSDYDLIATLENVIGSQKKHKDNAKCLEASLRQLELGFKTNYKDTLTLLSSD